MDKCPKKSKRMVFGPKYCVLLSIFLVANGAGANVFTDLVGKILFGLTGAYERKSLMFFADFGSTKNRNKKPGRLECDYDDPVKRKSCPPIIASPFAHTESAPKRKSAPVFPVKPVKCLVEPDDAECRDLEGKSPKGSLLGAKVCDGD
jgi:hypothetical protein